MYRTGERPKPNYSTLSPSGANEKLKQKKRLSFKEPEVETSHNPNWSNSNRIQSKQPALLAPTVSRPKKSTSLEDLTLEDQTFIIAKHVGQAFDKRCIERRQQNITIAPKTICSDSRTICGNSVFLNEAQQKDCSHVRNHLQKNVSNPRAALTSEDAEYFEALSPPVMNTAAMKFPAIEMNESSAGVEKLSQALVVPSSDVISTSVQHQMQFMKYQLEQQRQQTQAALAHIQLLKDQLQAETTARYKAQTQNHQLLIQNKELLDHIQHLFRQIQDLEKLLVKPERKPTFLPSASQGSQEIQDANMANALTAPKNNNNGYHPAEASAITEATTSAFTIRKSNSYSDKTSTAAETNTTSPTTTTTQNSHSGNHRAQASASFNTEMTANKTESYPTKTNPYAPNTTMATRRSSLTSIKSFQSKPNYLDEPNKRNEDRVNSRDTSPVPPTIPISKNPTTAQITYAGSGRSFLFKSTPKNHENKDSSTKDQHDEVKNNSNMDHQSTPKIIATSNPKTLVNNELHIREEDLNENSFLVVEKRPRKLEGYTSTKNHVSDLTQDSSKISSVPLSPKSYSTWSKPSKFHKNDNVLPLAFENTAADLCIKENQRFSSGTSRLFKS